MRSIPTALSLTLTLALAIGCSSTKPRRIEATGDEAVTSFDLDYGEFVEIAADMANRLVTQPNFLNYPPYADHLPVKMVLSDIDNRTGIRDLPVNQITGRVRSAALNSGKVRFVSSFGGGETDSVVQGSQDAIDDPRFKQEEIPEQGSLSYPQTSLRTIIDKMRSTDGTARQNTFVVHMFVSEISSGEILWEEFSEPVAKRVEKGGYGF